MFGWVFRRQDSVESALIKGKDFKSIWQTAFLWLNLDPDKSDPANIPQEAAELIHKIILGYLKKVLVLRRRSGRRVPVDSLVFLFRDENFYRVKLWDCLSKGIYDKEFLSGLYLERANLLQWCEKEFIPFPSFWMPQLEEDNSSGSLTDADDENEGWYEALTERRRQRVTCLEVARKLWKINPNRTYEEVFHHSDMKVYGYPNSFSFNSFKKWARAFAPDYAKNGGRRSENK